MRGRLLAALALIGVVALAGCEDVDAPTPPAAPDAPRPSAPPAPGRAFVHTVEGDVSGYYLPVAEVAVGPYRLDHIFLGQGFDFEAWEGGERNGTFAPIMLSFDDTSSPMVQTELGEAQSVTVRVLPTAYSVSDDAVRFAGTSEELGAVSLVLRLDREALATAKRNLGDEAPVLTGRLTVGQRTFDDARFRWYGGD